MLKDGRRKNDLESWTYFYSNKRVKRKIDGFIFNIYYIHNFAGVKEKKRKFLGKSWREREDSEDRRFYFKSWEEAGRSWEALGDFWEKLGFLQKFPESSQKIPRKFPENSQKIPRKFPENSQKIPRKFPENSQNIPRKFPAVP
ncbi:MAG: hypothetical protein IJH67_05985, partial [Thermoguttaceae bacterium]|nr:hypothetical protein [Thermoguttaceae bacterium]